MWIFFLKLQEKTKKVTIEIDLNHQKNPADQDDLDRSTEKLIYIVLGRNNNF